MPAPYQERVYEHYVSAFKGRKAQVDYLFSDSKLLPLVKDWVKPIDRGAACVDLGCGRGNLLHALQTLGFRNLHGVDLSAEQIDLAHKIFPKAEVGNVEQYLGRFSDGYFSLITMFDVIEHMTKAEILRLLDLVVLKLTHGGIFIAHCPNGDSPGGIHVFASDFTHETLLNVESAELICRLAGLKNFSAREDLGASSRLAGRIRRAAWSIRRAGIRAVALVELGHPGPQVLTRNFAFKASKG